MTLDSAIVILCGLVSLGLLIGVPLLVWLLKHLLDNKPNIKGLEKKRDIEGLVQAMDHKNRHVQLGAVNALDNIGWIPSNDRHGAIYWIHKCNWDKCANIGGAAVEPLVEAFYATTSKKTYLYTLESRLHRSIVVTLGKIGDEKAVEPLLSILKKADANGFEILFDALTQIGAPAVGPLVELLQDSRLDIRKNAAQALLKIYKSGQIDETNRHFILSQKRKITQKHEDCHLHTDSLHQDRVSGTTHHDQGFGDRHVDGDQDIHTDIHADWPIHNDKGIGIRFVEEEMKQEVQVQPAVDEPLPESKEPEKIIPPEHKTKSTRTRPSQKEIKKRAKQRRKRRL